jgi:hypothetical protein
MKAAEEEVEDTDRIGDVEGSAVVGIGRAAILSSLRGLVMGLMSPLSQAMSRADIPGPPGTLPGGSSARQGPRTTPSWSGRASIP